MTESFVIVGSDARARALAWKLRLEKAQVHVVPEPRASAHLLAGGHFEHLAQLAREHGALTIVSGEELLAKGIVDSFQNNEHGPLDIVGPTRSAAQVESSKLFAKMVMDAAGIPTARWRVFSSYPKARAFIKENTSWPIVVKASGLARGKGVFICHDAAMAVHVLHNLMVFGRLGEAGHTVLIEEALQGPEVSLHALCSGTTFKMLLPSRDYKRLYDGDAGPNTGGMGAFAPVHVDNLDELGGLVVAPLLQVLAQIDSPFSGFLYPGLMLTEEGPKVVEYNSRLGNPEADVLMRLLKSNLGELLRACVDGTLAQQRIEWYRGYAVSVVLAAPGYPDEPQLGGIIHGIEKAQEVPGVVLFKGGAKERNGQLRVAAGRVIDVTARGRSLLEARKRAYRAVDEISFEGMYYRRDIAASR